MLELLINMIGRSSFLGFVSLVTSNSRDSDSFFTNDEENSSGDHILESGYHTIVESLADGSSRLVSEVREFVEELRRITLLWEELWLGSLIQIHHDFEKHAHQLNDEIKRVNSSTSLTNQEKAALIKGKHVALMKPVRNHAFAWKCCLFQCCVWDQRLL